MSPKETESFDVLKGAQRSKKEAITWSNGQFRFCVPMDSLDEMILCRSFIPIVKHGPSHCQGFSTLRGQVIHVLSSGWLFNQLGLSGSEHGTAQGKRLIIFNEGKSRWGIVADEVGPVLDLSLMTSKPWSASQLKSAYIVEWEGHSYFVLPPAELVKKYE